MSNLILLVIYLIGGVIIYFTSEVTTKANPEYHRSIKFALLWPVITVVLAVALCTGKAKWVPIRKKDEDLS